MCGRKVENMSKELGRQITTSEFVDGVFGCKDGIGLSLSGGF
jgi:hypothetical protein